MGWLETYRRGDEGALIAQEENYDISHLDRVGQSSKDIRLPPFLTNMFRYSADHSSIRDSTACDN